MNDKNLVTKILISIVSKNQRFNEIHRETGISPRIVRKYLDNMKIEGLIEEEERNWKKGKSKLCSITEKGRFLTKVKFVFSYQSSNLKPILFDYIYH